MEVMLVLTWERLHGLYGIGQEGRHVQAGGCLARGRNQWHAAVNVALCLRVPKLA